MFDNIINLKDKQLCLNIILVLCVVVMAIYMIKQNKQMEHMTETNTDDKKVHDMIKKVYDLDVAAIRNLSNLAGELKNGNDITIPGNLKVTGSFNLLPRGTILAWKGTTPPAGWALCDGQNETPDLRGRFILGSGQGSGLTKRDINNKGGSEKVKLEKKHLPPHVHHLPLKKEGYAGNYWSIDAKHGGDKKEPISGPHLRTTHNASHELRSEPHENMPPYYVLAWIMKL